MAFARLRRAGSALLVTVLLGVGCAQGSGSHLHAEQAPNATVLGAVESRGPATDPHATDAGPNREPISPDLAAVDWAAAGSPGSAEDATAQQDPAAPPTSALIAAPPTTVAEPSPSPNVDADDLVARTLAEIRYPWETVLTGWQVRFLPGRAGLRGMTFPDRRVIELYVRYTDTPAGVARVLAHELGHAVDVQHNNARDRARWRAAREVEPAVAWWPSEAASDFATLAGDFAEAFAVWLLGGTSRSEVGGPLTDEQLAVLASIVP